MKITIIVGMDGAVVVNGRFMQHPVAGVERYAREVSNRLPGKMRVLAPGNHSRGLRGQLWEQLVLPRLLGRDELLWSPANSGPLLVERQVVTVHDLSVLEHPEWYQPAAVRWYTFLLPRLVHRARTVLTLSEFARRKILERLGLPPEQVVRIPAGVDLEHFRPASIEETGRIRQHYNLPGDYYLFVGSLLPRRNLARLLEAWEVVQTRFPKMRLVIAGDPPPGMRDEINLPNLPGLHPLGFVSEEDLPALYSGALAFISPAMEEGFGLAALEAMACGAPVIAANSGAFPEVVGDAGLLVNTNRSSEIAEAMVNLASDARLQADLCCRGLDRARLFSWDQAARQVAKVFETI